MADQDPWSDFEKGQEHSSLIDFKRVGYRAVRYWYLVVLTLITSLAIAFYNNRYSQRIYPVSASIIIREREETTGGELLYKNALIDPYRNYLNEPYLIRSYPLIKRVVEELNFTVSFYREGYFMTSEAYDFVPLKAKHIETILPNGGKYILKLIDPESYSLEVFGKESVDRGTFKLGDTVVFGGYKLRIDKIDGRSFRNQIGTPYLLVIRSLDQVTNEYVGKLGVKWAEEGSGVINLTVNGPNPIKEIDFINGLIQNYQQYDLEKKNLAADRSIDFIKDQLSRISDSLKLFENQLLQFKKRNRTSGNLTADAQRIYSKVESLETQKAELLIKSSYYSYLKKYISESKNLEQIILPSSLGVTDPILTSIVSKIIDLQLEIKLVLDREKSLNPLINSRINRLNELKRELIESTESLKSTDKIKLDFLNDQIAQAEKLIGYLPLAERQLISIERNYSLLENLYVFLMQKMSEAGISKASNVSDIIMVNPPMRGGAISPKTSTNYLMAAGFGLALPFVFFVLFEILNNRVQSREDIENLTRIPFVGGIGHNPITSNLIASLKPKSAVAESFRSLRSNLNFFTSNQLHQIFMVSSSISGEGKTFTTINLATVIALSGKRTLIIGADMRRPKIFTDFELSNDRGLSGFLSGISSFDDVVQKTKINNLDLVSGGPVPPNPSELLITVTFEQFLIEARKRYEYVLIDTPPLALVTDAFVIAKFVDHTVFVVRQNYTPKSFIRAINDYYVSGKIPKVSILLNDIYKSGLGYGYGVGYGYHYGYSYSYGYGYGKRGKNKQGEGYYEES